jgi:hypothetical protein
VLLLTGFGLALAAALAGGGRLGRLADLRLRAPWIFYAAIGLQLAAFPAGLFPWSVGDRVATAMSLCSYAMLAVATAVNRRIPGTPLIGLGLASNVAAMLANGGHMPASASALRSLGRVEHGVHANSVALAHPSLPLLIDRFATPRWVPMASVFSVGDVLIVAGAAALLWSATGARAPWSVNSAGDPDGAREVGQIPPAEHAELNAGAGVRGVDEAVVAGVDADVAGAVEEHQVARPQVGSGDMHAFLELLVARARELDAEPPVHVLDEP